MAKSNFGTGYGKPPKSGQFKPGQSGNSKGRPKGTKNLKTDLAEELGEMITIRESGISKKVSKQRAVIKALMARAVQGDSRSISILLNMFLKILHEDTKIEEDIDLTQADLEILELYEAQILASTKTNKQKKESTK
jgi:hypothetical protein